MNSEILNPTSLHRTSRRFAEIVKRKRWLNDGDRILVAVSGGPDSVALLFLMMEIAPTWHLDILAFHLNHGLRGEESEGDAQFVRHLCRQLGLTLKEERAPLAKAHGLEGKGSIQEKARDVRYAAMRRVAENVGARKIALGHTADDQAETVLMWMLRGAGAAGLAGIPPTRSGLFIRPILDFRRSEILSYLRGKGLSFRSDSSNSNIRYFRNQIRHELLPTLQRLNPGIVRVLGRQADILREEELWFEEWTAETISRLGQFQGNGDIVLERDDVLALPLPLQRRVVRRLVCRLTGTHKAPSFTTVSDVLDRVVRGPSGSTLVVQGIRVERVYHTLRWSRESHHLADSMVFGGGSARVPAEGLEVSIPSIVSWPFTDQAIRVRVFHSQAGQPPGSLRTSPHRAWFDADRFTTPLRLRTWVPGDSFQPLGMQGHRKKLQDFYSDLKVPRSSRRRIPLLVAPEGILWVVGFRSDWRFSATASTRNFLEVEIRCPQSRKERVG